MTLGDTSSAAFLGDRQIRITFPRCTPTLPNVFWQPCLAQGAVLCGALAACRCRGQALRRDRRAEGAGPFFLSKVVDGGRQAYLGGVLEATWVFLREPQALTWLQTEPRCGSLDLAALRTLEVAGGCLASCVHLPGVSHGHSQGLLQREPYPSHRCPRVAPWSFAWRQVALLGDAGVPRGGPLVREGAGEGCQRHHFG